MSLLTKPANRWPGSPPTGASSPDSSPPSSSTTVSSKTRPSPSKLTIRLADKPRMTKAEAVQRGDGVTAVSRRRRGDHTSDGALQEGEVLSPVIEVAVQEGDDDGGGEGVVQGGYGVAGLRQDRWRRRGRV